MPALTVQVSCCCPHPCPAPPAAHLACPPHHCRPLLGVQVLEVEDGLCPQLLRVLGGGGWGALREVGLSGCNLWIDLEPAELALLEGQLAALPALTAKITKFECSCQGMAEGGESFFRHLTALRSLELGERGGLGGTGEGPRSWSLDGLRKGRRQMQAALAPPPTTANPASIWGRVGENTSTTPHPPACPHPALCRGLDGSGPAARLLPAAHDAPPHPPRAQHSGGPGGKPARPALPHTGAAARGGSTCCAGRLLQERGSCVATAATAAVAVLCRPSGRPCFFFFFFPLPACSLWLASLLPPTARVPPAAPQVRELSLVGCYRASRGLAALPNLVMLDLQPLQGLDAGEDGERGRGAGQGAEAAQPRAPAAARRRLGGRNPLLPARP